MKRKLLHVLAVLVPFGFFLAAREAASWRPQRIAAAEFNSRVVFPPVYRRDMGIAPLWWRQLAKAARSKRWQLEAVSPDHRRMLVSGLAPNFCYTPAVLNSDGQIIARLPSWANKESCGEWDGIQFSPDGTLVSFSPSAFSPIQVFDARIGQRLWRAESIGEVLRFSPDKRLAALHSENHGSLWLLYAHSGVRIRRLPVSAALSFEEWGFSRDGDSIVAKWFDPSSTPASKIPTSQFWSWRIR